MKKMKTLFKKNPNDLGRVINEIDPENEWVEDYGIPTRKYDGTACAIISNELYKRYDAKINKKTGIRKPIPEGAIPCQEADPHGSWPHWVKCSRDDPADKWHFDAFDKLSYFSYKGKITTYELCGPKINGNREKLTEHYLIPHGKEILEDAPVSYLEIGNYLSTIDIEGIVFHHMNDGRMCKIRKSDYGIKRI